MRRFHLFEFEDYNWFPNSLRLVITDFLGFFLNKFKTYDNAQFILGKLLEQVNEDKILDMCSGSGIPAKRIIGFIRIKNQFKGYLQLSDKFPANSSTISYDVLNDLPNESKIRTMFSAFHHFKPEQAKEILAQCHRDNSTVMILEFTERSLLGILFMFLGIPIVMLCAPFIKPFRFSRIFWTYIIPVAPFVFLWDGIASALRSYTTKELIMLTNGLDSYFWHSGKIPVNKFQNLTYLIGIPQEKIKQS